LSVLAKQLVKKTPLMKPPASEEIIFIKTRLRSVTFLFLLKFIAPAPDLGSCQLLFKLPWHLMAYLCRACR